ncbi:MAG TPA: hypothetical protein VFE47_01325 [Tepidisphaeraceae bacterium]|jgi:hypothetical protein|nr:hypothetical protein [Tepidisphaeraceae bacterium]
MPLAALWAVAALHRFMPLAALWAVPALHRFMLASPLRAMTVFHGFMLTHACSRAAIVGLFPAKARRAALCALTQKPISTTPIALTVKTLVALLALAAVAVGISLLAGTELRLAAAACVGAGFEPLAEHFAEIGALFPRTACAAVVGFLAIGPSALAAGRRRVFAA